jgi:hypothetical protein
MIAHEYIVARSGGQLRCARHHRTWPQQGVTLQACIRLLCEEELPRIVVRLQTQCSSSIALQAVHLLPAHLHVIQDYGTKFLVPL